MTDPLAFMPMPDWTTVTAKASTANPCVDGPGRYGSYALLLVVHAAARPLRHRRVQRGVEHLRHDRVTGVGVTLYFTCGTAAVPTACSPTTDDGSTLDMSGASSLALSAPTDGPLEGLAVVFDRNNDRVLRIVGTGGPAITGTIYAPSAIVRERQRLPGSFQSMIVVEIDHAERQPGLPHLRLWR